MWRPRRSSSRGASARGGGQQTRVQRRRSPADRSAKDLRLRRRLSPISADYERCQMLVASPPPAGPLPMVRSRRLPNRCTAGFSYMTLLGHRCDAHDAPSGEHRTDKAHTCGGIECQSHATQCLRCRLETSERDRLRSNQWGSRGAKRVCDLHGVSTVGYRDVWTEHRPLTCFPAGRTPPPTTGEISRSDARVTRPTGEESATRSRNWIEENRGARHFRAGTASARRTFGSRVWFPA